MEIFRFVFFSDSPKMSEPFFTKGIELVRQAVSADEQEDYEHALSLYTRALEFLLTGLKCMCQDPISCDSTSFQMRKEIKFRD